MCGNWTRQASFFQTYNGINNSLEVQNYPVNQITNKADTSQGFISKIRSDTGEWVWVLPMIGNNNIISKELKYSKVNKSILFNAYFNSETQYIYKPQLSIQSPTGINVFPNLGLPQMFTNNTSQSSSMILSLDQNGYIKWDISLNSLVPQTYVDVYSIEIDEFDYTDTRIVLSGISNTTILLGKDGTNNQIQSIYANIDPLLQQYNMSYSFNISSGAYQSSTYIKAPLNSRIINYGIKSFSDINQVITFSSVYTAVNNSSLSIYNKDGSLANIQPILTFTPQSFVATYDHNSIFQDNNTFSYSQLYIYNYTGPTSSLTGSLVNYSAFILGNVDDILINKSFAIRNSDYNYNTNTLKVTLNQIVLTNRLIRKFDTINGNTGSNNYYACNISSSPQYDVGAYDNITQSGNSIIFSNLYNHQEDFNTSNQYYFTFPKVNTGGTGYYTSIVPINSIVYNSNLKQYTATVTDINDLRVESPSGALYGPYININEKNYSAYYSLQWYPGSRLYSQTYLVGLYDLIIPNRPIRNSRYPGTRFITDFPYIYLIIYNATENDEFNPAVVNSVYDNNIDVPKFALFQIATTTFSSQSITESNYISASSSSTPKIIFSPNYYKIHFKLTDDRGNLILFDNIPYKETDSIFADGIVPDELLNITVRLAFKRA